MIIAYSHEFPTSDELTSFLQAYTTEMNNIDHTRLRQLSNDQQHYVIAAYEGEQLIGVGYLPFTGIDQLNLNEYTWVLETYSKRGIDQNIQKLLLAEWKFSPAAAMC
ncbi:hypothetical protein D3C73_628720 [compost metagenome]